MKYCECLAGVTRPDFGTPAENNRESSRTLLATPPCSQRGGPFTDTRDQVGVDASLPEHSCAVASPAQRPVARNTQFTSTPRSAGSLARQGVGAHGTLFCHSPKYPTARKGGKLFGEFVTDNAPPASYPWRWTKPTSRPVSFTGASTGSGVTTDANGNFSAGRAPVRCARRFAVLQPHTALLNHPQKYFPVGMETNESLQFTAQLTTVNRSRGLFAAKCGAVVRLRPGLILLHLSRVPTLRPDTGYRRPETTCLPRIHAPAGDLRKGSARRAMRPYRPGAFFSLGVVTPFSPCTRDDPGGLPAHSPPPARCRGVLS